MKKFISLLIAAILVFTCAATAFATEDESEVKTFTVTYSANSPDYTGKTPEAAKVETGKETTIADALVMTGYKFAGWNTKADGEGDALVPGSKYTPTADITLYGKWEKDEPVVKEDEPVVTEYTLTYVTGVETIKFDAIKLKEGDKVVLHTEAKEGYKLNGWYADKEFKTAAPEKMPAADLTVYASYTKLYRLSFDTQDLKKIDAVWLEEGAAIVLPSANVENYKFMGWFTDAKCQKAIEKNAKMPKADTVLYGCYAIKLSKLGTIFEDIDMEQDVKDAKLTPEEFNKYKKPLGYGVKYSVNGKTYTVNDIVNFTDELISQLKKYIEFGDIAAVDITINRGKKGDKNLAIYVYNDVEDKKADKPATPDKDTPKANTDNKKSNDEKTTDIPNTGAESIAPAVITFLTSMATVGGAVVLKKKKEN